VRVAIRADASRHIGHGHAVRCLALADRLRRDGADVLFVMRELEGNVADWLRSKGHSVSLLQQPGASDRRYGMPTSGGRFEIPISDAFETQEHLKAWGRADWLIVDHYGIDRRWETEVRSCTARLLAIDDLADREHDVDVLVDINSEADPSRYRGLVPEKCELLLGPRYALLREQFANTRSMLRSRKERLRKLLICFGGVDAPNATRFAIGCTVAAGVEGMTVVAVVGSGNPHAQDLLKEFRSNAAIEILQGVEDMASLMSDADLFLGSGGGLTWERMSVGLPGITIAISSNQIRACEMAAEAGADVFLGCEGSVTEGDVAAILRSLSINSEKLRSMSAAASEVCDGLGAVRISNLMHRGDLRFRRAEKADCEPIFRWRNHPSVRAMSHTDGELEFESHRRWFEATITDENRILLIGERCAAGGPNEPMGVVRYDIHDRRAKISIYVVPECQGRGFGTSLLKGADEWLRHNRPDVETIEAEVLPNNTASQAMFHRAGYKKPFGVFIREMSAL
jgi:UDP-2,4-diacetamido-2,4,6-trideoxy-beta-L-altropyranose hydrolase